MAQADMFREGVSPIVTADFLAEVFGVGRSMVYKYQDQGMPREARGRYDLRKCVQWLVAKMSHRGGDDPDDLQSARLELVKAQTEGQQLENRRKAGELLPADQVARALNDIAVIVSSQLDGLASRCAGRVAAITEPGAVQRELFEETRQIREAVAQATHTYADDLVARQGKEHEPDQSPAPIGKQRAARKKRAIKKKSRKQGASVASEADTA